MITVQILEDEDRILKEDFVRQLSLTFEGQSDYLATSSTYGGSAVNRLGWVPAKYHCPAWVGKTVGEFRKAVLKLGRHSTETCNYEFIRGKIPANHLEKLTKSQLKIANMVWENQKDEHY